MPFLKQQIEVVNAQLLSTALADVRFAQGRIEAIAVDVARTDPDGKIDFYPAVMDANYQAQPVVVDDTYSIIIYHKALQKQYGLNKSGEFGDGNKLVSEVVNVKMVVYAKYAAVKMTREQLEALITTNFPDQIAPAVFKPLKLDNLSVVLQGSNLNSADVWSQEYKGTPLRLAPEDIYFSINYQLQSNFRKGCFKICDCV